VGEVLALVDIKFEVVALASASQFRQFVAIVRDLAAQGT